MLLANPLRFIFIFILLASTNACRNKDPAFNYSFIAFGTLIDLTIVNTQHDKAVIAAESIEKDFLRQHKQWHAWQKGELKDINDAIAASKSAPIPPEMRPLIDIGMKLSQKSNHYFNPTIGRLIELWGFHDTAKKNKEPPSAGAISYLLKKSPTMEDIKIEGNQISSRNNTVQLDFGAYGKGYGIDLAVKHLRQLGIDNAIVNAGGDLRAIGSRGGQPWKIAIRKPSGSGVFATIDIKNNESIFTSGDYERYFTYHGVDYHHIIDPRTGYPATGTTSVTVIDKNATLADAAATAIFIAGPDEWYSIAHAMGVKYVALVDKKGIVHVNPAMQKRLKLINTKLKMEVSEPLISKKKFHE